MKDGKVTLTTAELEKIKMAAFARGIIRGREQVRDELLKLLGLDDYIASRITLHEQHHH